MQPAFRFPKEGLRRDPYWHLQRRPTAFARLYGSIKRQNNCINRIQPVRLKMRSRVELLDPVSRSGLPNLRNFSPPSNSKSGVEVELWELRRTRCFGSSVREGATRCSAWHRAWDILEMSTTVRYGCSSGSRACGI